MKLASLWITSCGQVERRVGLGLLFAQSASRVGSLTAFERNEACTAYSMRAAMERSLASSSLHGFTSHFASGMSCGSRADVRSLPYLVQGTGIQILVTDFFFSLTCAVGRKRPAEEVVSPSSCRSTGQLALAMAGST